MSNDSFRKIADTVVSASTVATPELSKLIFSSSSTGGNLSTVALTGANVALSSANLKTAASQALFISVGAIGSSLTVGADTAANAKNLQNLFGLKSVGDGVLLTFVNSGATVASIVTLANTSGTFTNVIISLRGAGSASIQTLASNVAVGSNVTPSGVAYVALLASNVTPGSEIVTFDVKLPIAVSL